MRFYVCIFVYLCNLWFSLSGVIGQQLSCRWFDIVDLEPLEIPIWC